MLRINAYRVYKLQFSRAVLWSFNGENSDTYIYMQRNKSSRRMSKELGAVEKKRMELRSLLGFLFLC